MNACNLRARKCEQMLEQKQNNRICFDRIYRVEHDKKYLGFHRKLYSMRKLEANRKQGEEVPNTRTLKSFRESNARFPEKRKIVVDSPDQWL